MPDWIWSVAALATAPLLAAFLSGYLVNRWKGRQDHIEKRFDELCDSVLATADLAADYWAGSAEDEGMALREAKIVAQRTKIAGLRVMLSRSVSASTDHEIQSAEAKFFRETTGGSFGVHNRVAESHRIIACHCAAADMIVAIRRARLHDLQGFWTRR
jgi:hypothetical protein